MVARMYIWPRYVLEVGTKRMVFTRRPGAALARLFRRPGGLVSMDEMIEAVYFDDPDGGPDAANNCIRVFIFRMRKILKKVGIDIQGYRGTGGFRLILPGQKIPRPYSETPVGRRGPYVFVGPDPEQDAYDASRLNHSTGLNMAFMGMNDGSRRVGRRSASRGP